MVMMSIGIKTKRSISGRPQDTAMMRVKLSCWRGNCRSWTMERMVKRLVMEMMLRRSSGRRTVRGRCSWNPRDWRRHWHMMQVSVWIRRSMMTNGRVGMMTSVVRLFSREGHWRQRMMVMHSDLTDLTHQRGKCCSSVESSLFCIIITVWWAKRDTQKYTQVNETTRKKS